MKHQQNKTNNAVDTQTLQNWYYQDPIIQQFCESNKMKISLNNFFDNFYDIIEEYYLSLEMCKNTTSDLITTCQQKRPGFNYKLVWEYNRPRLHWRACQHTINWNNKRWFLKNFLIKYNNEEKFIDQDFKRCLETNTFDSKNPQQKRIITGLYDYLNNNQTKGITIYGNGTGKTFILIAFANTLAKTGHKIAFIEVPQWFNKYKNKNKNDFNWNEINVLKNVKILFLDDLGLEIADFTIRDILIEILHDRLNNQRATFISTRFNMNDLQERYQCFPDKINRLKAARLIEIILKLTNVLEFN